MQNGHLPTNICQQNSNGNGSSHPHHCRPISQALTTMALAPNQQLHQNINSRGTRRTQRIAEEDGAASSIDCERKRKKQRIPCSASPSKCCCRPFCCYFYQPMCCWRRHSATKMKQKGKQPEDAQPPQHQQHHQQQQQQSCSTPPPCIVTLASPKRSRCHRRESLKADDHHNNICLLPVVRHPSSSICCPSSPAGCSSSTPPARSSTRDSRSDSTDYSASSRRTSSSSSSSAQSCDCHKRHRRRCLKRQRQRSYRRCPEKAYCRLLKENTTFHGIRDSIQTAGWLRALWVCIIVLASVAALIGCGLIVWEFNTRPLSVTYSIRENVSLVLPDIVICPFNRFNRTFLQSANVSDQLAQYLELAFPQASQHPFQYKSYKELLDHIDELEAELVQLLDTLGISFAEFIKQSAIDCRAFFVNKAICDTVQELMTMAGKCFRIPGEEQRNDGHGHAQRIIVRLPTQLYNPAPNQMMNHGIVVKLAERGKGIDHDMSFVPAGVHAIFPLTATRFEFKHYPPHFLCREEEDTTYSRVWCFEECFLDKAERECNCSLAAAAQPGTSNICTPRQFFNCVYTVLRFDDANVVDEQVAQCKSRCLPPCKNWRYEKTVTYAHFPSETARHFVKVPAKWEELQNTIILEVFYTTLDYTVIQQMLTITPSSFVAQLGGQISLWIGGSIISVMQLFIYVFSYFCVYFRRTNGQRRRRSAAKAIDNNSGPTAAAADDDADDNEGRKRRRKRREERKSRKSSRVEDEKDNREEQWHTLNGLRLHQDGTMKRNNNNVACITVRV